MSTIVTSSCAGNGLSSPASLLTNKLFQDFGVASSTRKLIEQENNTANSFRFSNLERKKQENGNNEDFNSWNNFIRQSEDDENWFKSEFLILEQEIEEEEEFRQEWSDEKFTEVYIKQCGLDRSYNDKASLHNKPTRSYEHPFVQEFIKTTVSQDSSFMANDNAITYNTIHNDLFQAQIYILDHLLSAFLEYPITTTYRPSPRSEWNWAKLFSSSRWCNNNENDDNKMLDSEYLQNVALERVQLLLGHIIIDVDSNQES